MGMPVGIAVDLLLALIENAARISTIVRQAQASGSDRLTKAQWHEITDLDDQARARLEAAIAALDSPRESVP